MEFLKNFEFKPLAILKVAGVAVGVIILLAIAFRLVGSSFQSVMRLSGIKTQTGINNEISVNNGMVDESFTQMDMDVSGAGGSFGLSMRNVASMAPNYNKDVVIGDDAEDYEVTEYRAVIKTADLEQTCSTVADLKIKDYVIFENSSEYDTGCSYNFKVKHENANEILAIIESLDPKDLTEEVHTIKRRIDDYTSEVEVLKKKRSSIDETLNNAIIAYDEITDLATKTQDVESLAKIIDSKIRIIERLTSEKIRINEQLDRLSRAKSEQLDRLDYTYFNIDIHEDKYINGENLKDSWKLSIKKFVQNINKFAQDITVNLIVLVFLIIQYALYLLILIIVVKYGWKLVKHIWWK